MAVYFEKYPIHVILRNGLPFDKVSEVDKGEVERLSNIYDRIFPIAADKISNFKLTLKDGLLSTSTSENKPKITIDEFYSNLQKEFNCSIDDIKLIIKIDDKWNLNCVNCEGCKYCVNCVNCVNCEGCDLCFRCHDCKNTINRRDQTGLINDDSHFPLIIGETFTPNDPLLDNELK